MFFQCWNWTVLLTWNISSWKTDCERDRTLYCMSLGRYFIYCKIMEFMKDLVWLCRLREKQGWNKPRGTRQSAGTRLIYQLQLSRAQSKYTKLSSLVMISEFFFISNHCRFYFLDTFTTRLENCVISFFFFRQGCGMFHIYSNLWIRYVMYYHRFRNSSIH